MINIDELTDFIISEDMLPPHITGTRQFVKSYIETFFSILDRFEKTQKKKIDAIEGFKHEFISFRQKR